MQIDEGPQINSPEGIGAAAVYHILPDEDAQTVAIVVVEHGLDFGVLAEHVEAELFHGGELVKKRLCRGRGINALLPISLIEKSVLKNRDAV